MAIANADAENIELIVDVSVTSDDERTSRTGWGLALCCTRATQSQLQN